MHSIRLFLLAAVIAATPVALADDDGRRGPDVAPVTNKLYRQECGSCHMAYQPGLLPARSWEKLMTGLDKHFGDNAEFAAEDRKAITEYLVANAADRARERRAQKIVASLGRSDTPLRIIETPYLRSKHREIPVRLVKDNPKVKSLNQCNACHIRAEAGSYRESEINIAGYGRWEDD
jgi:hypothetical protein